MGAAGAGRRHDQFVGEKAELELLVAVLGGRGGEVRVYLSVYELALNMSAWIVYGGTVLHGPGHQVLADLGL